MSDDQYTMDARLCDDQGMVSHERHPKFDGSYIGFLNHLRSFTNLDPYLGDPFPCTMSAHLAAEHIRCTSPAHNQPPTQRVSESKVEIIPSNVLSHGGPHRPDENGVCKDCQRQVVRGIDEVELMDEMTWTEVRQSDPIGDLRRWQSYISDAPHIDPLHRLERSHFVRGEGRILMAKPGDIISDLMDQAGIKPTKISDLSEAWEEIGSGKVVYAESELIPENKVYQIDGTKLFSIEGGFEMSTVSSSFANDISDFFSERPIPLTWGLSVTMQPREITAWRDARDKRDAAWREMDTMTCDQIFGRRWWRLLGRQIKYDWQARWLETVHPNRIVTVQARLDLHNAILSMP